MRIKRKMVKIHGRGMVKFAKENRLNLGESEKDAIRRVIDLYNDNTTGLYIEKKRVIKTNILFRLTIPVLFIIALFSLIFHWIFTGEWGFYDGKYANFMEKWEDKCL